MKGRLLAYSSDRRRDDRGHAIWTTIALFPSDQRMLCLSTRPRLSIPFMCESFTCEAHPIVIARKRMSRTCNMDHDCIISVRSENALSKYTSKIEHSSLSVCKFFTCEARPIFWCQRNA
jgi:hypothetical protein